MDNLIVNQKFQKLKNNIKKQGIDSLHIVSDFDRTLTYASVGGEKIPSIISILRDGNYLSKEYAEKAHALFNKYHSIEIDNNINPQKKKKFMEEWWRSHFELLIKSGLNKKDIEKVVESKKVKLRDGSEYFLKLLYKKNIPLVIISSSGLGTDSLRLYLEKRDLFYDNIFIISNDYIWDEEGNAIGVKEPIIHNMNKDETTIHSFPFYNKIKDRKNVLLLGDSLEDIGMVKGFDYKNLIKVGFLNENVDENLEIYKKNYDMLLLNDSSMDAVNKLLEDIIGCH